MKNKLRKIAQHPLVSGSTIIFSGTLLGNIFNFLFTIYMLSHLSLADNGILAAVVSLISIPSLAAGAIAPAIVNFAGTYFAKNEIAKAHDLYIKVGKLYLLMGMAFFLLTLLFIPQISSFFKIQNQFLLVIANIAIFMSFFYALNTAFLQAKLSFTYLSVLTISAAALKLLSGMFFTSNGFAVNGAVSALFLSFLLPFIISFSPLRSLLRRRTETTKINIRELFIYGLPSAVTVLGLTSFITADILLVKHFFSPTDAGYYASLSIIARVIFYFSSPIGTVMFPLVVQKISRNESYKSTFLLSMVLVLLPSIALTTVYFLLPEFVLHVFNVKNITHYDIKLLGYFGVFITLYALISVLANFYLSIRRTNVCYPIVVAAFAQIIAIWMYHGDFFTVILISLLISFLLLISLLIYYPYAVKEK